MEPSIRDERPGDEAAIRALTRAAFASMPYSDGSEAPITDGLREDGDLTLSLVAIAGGDIVGHGAFSPVTIAGGGDGWFGLGPVSVRPDRQRCGVGTRLIERGLADLRSRGAHGCALIGDPGDYQRFGFEGGGELCYGDLPAQLVQWLSFVGDRPVGALKFSPAFDRLQA